MIEEPPHPDHIRASLYSWLLPSIRKLHGDENSRIVQALQELLIAKSLVTENYSSKELDTIAVLTDLRSERSFNKDFFYKRINGNVLSTPTKQHHLLTSTQSLLCRVASVRHSLNKSGVGRT
jgi:hypothetical protein